MMQSKAEHYNAAVDVFATRAISRAEAVGVKYSLLVYTDLSKQLLSMKKYGERTSACSIRTTNLCIMGLSNMVTEL